MPANAVSTINFTLRRRVKEGWKALQHGGRWVCNDMRVQDGTTMLWLTWSYYEQCSLKWLKSNKDCIVCYDNKLIALHCSTRSDRVNTWSNNIALGNSPIRLTMVVADTHITPNARLSIMQTLNRLCHSVSCSTTLAGHLNDPVLVQKDFKLWMIASKSTTTKKYFLNSWPHCR